MKTNLLKKLLLSTLCVSVMFASVNVYSAGNTAGSTAGASAGNKLTSRDYSKLGEMASSDMATAVQAEYQATMDAQRYSAMAEESSNRANELADRASQMSADVALANQAEREATMNAQKAASKAEECQAKINELEKEMAEAGKKGQKDKVKKLQEEWEKASSDMAEANQAEREATMKAQQAAAMAKQLQAKADEFQQKADEQQAIAAEAAQIATQAQAAADAARKAIDEFQAQITDYQQKQSEAIEAEGGPLFSDLMWRFRDMDAAIAAGKLAQTDNMALTDYSAQADLLEKDAEVAVGALAQTWNLTQRDYETQADLLDLDSDIAWASYLGYHWWTLDYGLAREYALRPLEFGYFSYHAALNDTLGEYSTAERLYTTIFNGISLGLSVLGALPNIVNQVEGFVDAIDDYRKTSIAEDMRVAKEAGDAFRAQLAEEDAILANIESEAKIASREADALDEEANALDAEAADIYKKKQAAMQRGNDAEVEALQAKERELNFAAAEKRLEAEAKRAESDYYSEELVKHQNAAAALQKNVEIADAKYAEADKNLRDLLGIDDTQAGLNAASVAADDAATKLQNSQENLAVIQDNLNKEQAAYEQKAAEAAQLERDAALLKKAEESAGGTGDIYTASKYAMEYAAVQEKLGTLNNEMAESQKTIDILSKGAASAQKEINQNAASIAAANGAIQGGSADLRAKTAEYNVLSGNASEEDLAIYQQVQAQQAAAKQQSAQSAQSFANQMDAMQPGNIVTGVTQTGTSIVNGVFNVFGLGHR